MLTQPNWLVYKTHLFWVYDWHLMWSCEKLTRAWFIDKKCVAFDNYCIWSQMEPPKVVSKFLKLAPEISEHGWNINVAGDLRTLRQQRKWCVTYAPSWVDSKQQEIYWASFVLPCVYAFYAYVWQAFFFFICLLSFLANCLDSAKCSD